MEHSAILFTCTKLPLVFNCLQRLSADDKVTASKERIKVAYSIIKQWCGQNAEKVTHIKERLLEQAVILFNCLPPQNGNLKERICSQREQILSFKSSSLWYEKSLLPHKVTSLECYYSQTSIIRSTRDRRNPFE